MKDQQPDWAERLYQATRGAQFAGINKVDAIRQSLSGYCVVKRKVLEEVRNAMEGDHADWCAVFDLRHEFRQDCDCGYSNEVKEPALTKLNEILGGKQ